MYILWQSTRQFYVCYDLKDVEYIINNTKIDTTQYRLLKEVDITSELYSLKIRKRNEDALSFKE